MWIGFDATFFSIANVIQLKWARKSFADVPGPNRIGTSITSTSCALQPTTDFTSVIPRVYRSDWNGMFEVIHSRIPIAAREN